MQSQIEENNEKFVYNFEFQENAYTLELQFNESTTSLLMKILTAKNQNNNNNEREWESEFIFGGSTDEETHIQHCENLKMIGNTPVKQYQNLQKCIQGGQFTLNQQSQQQVEKQQQNLIVEVQTTPFNVELQCKFVLKPKIKQQLQKLQLDVDQQQQCEDIEEIKKQLQEVYLLYEKVTNEMADKNIASNLQNNNSQNFVGYKEEFDQFRLEFIQLQKENTEMKNEISEMAKQIKQLKEETKSNALLIQQLQLEELKAQKKEKFTKELMEKYDKQFFEEYLKPQLNEIVETSNPQPIIQNIEQMFLQNQKNIIYEKLVVDQSKILTTRIDQKLKIINCFKEWLPKNVKGIELLFRASRDGWKANDFHIVCDKKGPTLVIILANNRIFGGFNSQYWDQTKSYIEDQNAFIFSLDQNDILIPSSTTKQYAISNQYFFGPTFGNGSDDYSDIYICDNANKLEESVSHIGNTYYSKMITQNTKGTELSKTYLAGQEKFKVDEYEVFSIRF